MTTSQRRSAGHGGTMALTFALLGLAATLVGPGCGQRDTPSASGATGGTAGLPPPGASGGAAGAGEGAGGAAGAGTTPTVVPNCAINLSGYAGRHCAAYQDGSVWCWGTGPGEEDPSDFVPSATPTRVEGLLPAKRVYVGPGRSCAAGDGGFQCWGNNDKAQIDDSGISPLPPTAVPLDTGAIPAPQTGVGLGPSETCVVNAIAHVYCRGTDASGVVHRAAQIGRLGLSPDTRIPGPLLYVIESGQVYLIADWGHPEVLTFFGTDNDSISPGTPSCAVKRDGTLWCADYDFVEPGELAPKSALGAHALRVGTGDLFLCTLTDDHRVWCEGWNPVGQVGNGTDGAFAAGDYVGGLTDVRALSVNRFSACALTADGKVWCWGAYAAGQTSNTPVRLSDCANQRVAPDVPVRSVGHGPS